MDALQKWADEEIKLIRDPPNPDDRSLFREMIREWILEHAGDEEDPSTGTSEAQWRYALRVAKNPKEINEERRKMALPALPQALEAGKDLDNHPEIFAYQTRRHFLDAGLPFQDEVQQMINQVPDLMALNPANPAAAVKAYFNGKRFAANKTDQPQLLIRLLNRHLKTGPTAEWEKVHIERNWFIVNCKLHLDDDDGSVYVDYWEYALTYDSRGYRENPIYRIEFFFVTPD